MSSKVIVALCTATALLSGADRATIPMIVEGNRPFIDLSFRKPDGTERKARFWIDTGGGGFLLVQKLAADLGLRFEGVPQEEEGAKFWPTKAPRTWAGTFELDLAGCRAAIIESISGMPVEGL